MELWCLVVTWFVLVWGIVEAQSPPNIVFFLADDLGWNDVSWHDAGVVTPNLQLLANEGVLLEQNYVQPLCTPTRSALLTGYYPYHLGRQGTVLGYTWPTGLTLNYTLLPENLASLGYDTHMIGKWHLGFCDWSYTPNHRGFHTFYGFYQGNQDHYTHIAGDGYDFHDGDAVAWEANGNYSSIIYADRAVEIIQEQQNKQSPFFLYIAFQNVHDPLQVPQEYLDLYPGEVDPDRRALLGMVSAMDDAVGRVVETLRSTGLADNTLIVFSSDNGGTSPGVNLPLRGYKGSLWEGGTRVPALIHGSMLSNTPRLHSQLFHVTDWHATLLEAAEAPPLVNKNDGFSQWEALRSGQTLSPRESHIYNLNSPAQEEMVGAIRVGQYKLLVGPQEDTTEEGPWLFDLDNDPSETTNLAGDRPDLVVELEALLMAELDSLVPLDEPESDPAGDPSNFGGVWTPGWCVAH